MPIDPETGELLPYGGHDPVAETAMQPYPDERDDFRHRLAQALMSLQPPRGGQRGGGDSFGPNLLYGAARGFAGGVMSEAERREAMNERMRQAQHKKNEEARAAARVLATRRHEMRLQRLKDEAAKETPEQQIGKARNSRLGMLQADREMGVGEFAPPKSGAPDRRLVIIQTPDGPRYVTPSEALGKPPGSAARVTPRAATPAERQSLAFYQRANGAVEDLSRPYDKRGRSLEMIVATSGLPQQVRGRMAPNWAQSQEQQQYRQAQRAFTEARLRKESGAAIADHEYENDSKMYFAQPGDLPPTIRQKQRARARVLAGLKNSAGPAFKEFNEGRQDSGPAEDPYELYLRLSGEMP